MDLHQIEIFCALMKFRSFSKAAETLYLTQPTVSGHIRNLEDELGVKLLDRIGKRVVPTEAGDVLFRSGQELLALRDRAREEIKEISGGIAGVLKIGASTIPGAYILPSFIAAFKKKYSGASIHLEIGDTAGVIQLVLAGDLQIGLVGARPADPRVEIHPFQKDELVIAVPAGHAWARKKYIAAEALRGEPFILREKGSGSRRVMEERLAKAGISPADFNTVAIMGNNDAVCQSVKAGLGISILSNRALRDDVQARRLAAVRIKGLSMERNFFLILLRDKSRSPLCRAFLAFILKKKSGPLRN
jgi:DNA-binding transcriptional LysR family regulator